MSRLDARLAYVDARLDYEIDAVAAHDAVAAGEAVLVDTRRLESWEHGHIAGALHLPKSELASGIESLPRDRTLVVYGWGPGCNGATATARVLLAAGLDVRELLGGYEYWARNGFEVVSRQRPDPLVTAEPPVFESRERFHPDPFPDHLRDSKAE